MNFKIGKTYNHKWPDGAIAEFVVDCFDFSGIMKVCIIYANGSHDHFYIGSKMYKNSYEKA